MMFDVLCKVAEHSLSGEIKSYIKDAKIFKIEGKLSDGDIDPNVSDVHVDNINRFYLPYPSVAIEAQVMTKGTFGLGLVDTCILAYDKPEISSIMKQQYDTKATIGLMIISSYDNPMKGIRETCLQLGHITAPSQEGLEYNLGLNYYIHDWLPTDRTSGDELTDDQTSWYKISCMYFTEFINKINSPKDFIVRESSLKPVKNNGKKLLRAYQRPTHTILNLKTIQTRYNLTGIGEGTSKKAHPRRAHPRVLHSEKFTFKQGQEIQIPACWIGPSETRIGNKIYKVILDR